MRSKVRPSESMDVSVGRGSAFRFGLGIKQHCRAELFEGDPVYVLSNGKEVKRSEIAVEGIDRALWKEMWMGSEHEAHEGLVEAIHGIWLPPKNLSFGQKTHNIITDIGLFTMADNFLRTTPAPQLDIPQGMALGTSSTAASAGDTDVITTLAASFKLYTTNFPVRTSSTVDFRNFWLAGEATSATINEVVQKQADATANAVSRIVLTTINKGASDTLQITVTWDFDAP